MLLAERMTKLRIYVHSDYLDRVVLTLGEAGILHQTEAQESLEDLGGLAQPVEKSDRLFRITSALSRVQTMTSDLDVSEELPPQKEAEALVSDDDLDEIERRTREVTDRYQGISAQLADLEKSEKTVDRHEEAVRLRQEVKDLRKEVAAELLGYRQRLAIAKSLEEVKTKIAKTRNTYLIEGWVPQSRLDSLVERVNRASSGYFSIVKVDRRSSVRHESSEAVSPPTLLKNPKITYVHQEIVTAFGIPSYYEIDPSILMIISFPIIFGLMFGDVGHGTILFGLTVLLYVLKRKRVRTSELFNYIIQGSPLLMMCALASIFCGFLYGECLGSEHYYGMVEEGIHAVTGMGVQSTVRFYSESLERFLSAMAGFKIRVPFPFSPFRDQKSMLLVSIYMGILHISFGLVLDLTNKLRNRQFKEAVIGPGLWLWFYWGFSYLFLRYRSQVFNVVFQQVDVMAIYLMVPALVLVGVRCGVHRMDGFGHALESLIASLSNTISYARILALGLAHSAFSTMLLLLTELGGILSIVGWIMWALFTFLLILCFEGLLSFIHTLRLHWVEWFMKFYSGTGYEYQPFTLPKATS